MRIWATQLRKGLIELCVMAALQDGEAYGYEILQTLAGSQTLEVSESTVYPILARLAEEGAVTVRVAASPAGPPRRYYRLTASGKARLREMGQHWNQIRRAVDGLLKGAGS